MKTVIRLLLGVLLVAALSPGVALAAWNNCNLAGFTTDTGDVITKTKSIACHDTATGTATDSTLLWVKNCDHIQILFDPDVAGSETTAEAQIYTCAQAVANATNCTKLLVDTDGDGIVNDTTLNGTDMRKGIAWANAQWIWVDMTVAPTAGKVARTLVSCH